MIDGGHIEGGGFGDERCDIKEITDKEPGFGATDSLPSHDVLDAYGCEQVTSKSLISNLDEEIEEYE